MLNRINIEVFNETIKDVKNSPSNAIKTLNIEGTWRLDSESGPQFETKLKTENAGEILVQSDETIILGGGGTGLCSLEDSAFSSTIFLPPFF